MFIFFPQPDVVEEAAVPLSPISSEATVVPEDVVEIATTPSVDAAVDTERHATSFPPAVNASAVVLSERPTTSEDRAPRRKSRRSSNAHEHVKLMSGDGIQRIAKAKTLPQRIIWLLLFLASIVGTGLQLYELMTLFLSNPSEMRTDVELMSVADFPSVTLCNMNALKLSAAMDSERFALLSQIG